MTTQSLQLLATMGLTNLGFWLLWPVSVVRIEALGWGETITGLFGSAAWLACLVALALVPQLVRHWGFRATTGLACSLLFATAIGSELFSGPIEWLWTCLLGASLGLRWATVDAWLADTIAPDSRGRILSLGETMAGGTFALGPAVAAMLGTEGSMLKLSTAVSLCAVVGLLLCARVPEPHRVVRAGDQLLPSARHLTLGVPFAAAMVVLAAEDYGGFFESGFAAATSLLALANGSSDREALLAVTAVGFGSFLGQYGLGYTADRHGGCAVLLLCSTVLFTSMLVLALWPGGLVLVSVVVGAVGGGLYTVTVVFGLQATWSSTGSSTTLISSAGLAYNTGTLASPSGTGAALALFGPAGTIWMMAVLSLVLVLGLVAVRA